MSEVWQQRYKAVPESADIVCTISQTQSRGCYQTRNQFKVEYVNNGMVENRRPDVLLFVNGMPLCVIELKNPSDAHATIHDAWEQINMYTVKSFPSCAISSRDTT